ncbi:hypothetical protein DIPPA_00514 [Diplonema papillatum]|nr:hypothetical protein DIPPA_00514 [Diplonema papillatum]
MDTTQKQLVAREAVQRLICQCGTADRVKDVLRSLRRLAEYGGSGSVADRRIDTTAEGFASRVGAVPAGRELVALLGFWDRDGEDSGTLRIRAGQVSDPEVVSVIDSALQKYAPKDTAPVHAAVPRSPGAGQSARHPRSRPGAKGIRNPLTKRLPTVATAEAGTAGLTDTILASLQDGSSFVCEHCRGVAAIDRYEQHMKYWCPVSSSSATDEGESCC